MMETTKVGTQRMSINLPSFNQHRISNMIRQMMKSGVMKEDYERSDHLLESNKVGVGTVDRDRS